MHQWIGLHEYYSMETPKKKKKKTQKSLKFEFWLVTKSWNHLSFVNISPTLAIDTSMENSWILHHGNPKKLKKSSKLTKLNFIRTQSVHTREKKSPWLRQYQSYISNWYNNGKVFTSTTPWNPTKFFFFLKFEIRILTCADELKSP